MDFPNPMEIHPLMLVLKEKPIVFVLGFGVVVMQNSFFGVQNAPACASSGNKLVANKSPLTFEESISDDVKEL